MTLFQAINTGWDHGHDLHPIGKDAGYGRITATLTAEISLITARPVVSRRATAHHPPVAEHAQAARGFRMVRPMATRRNPD